VQADGSKGEREDSGDDLEARKGGAAESEDDDPEATKRYWDAEKHLKARYIIIKITQS